MPLPERGKPMASRPLAGLTSATDSTVVGSVREPTTTGDPSVREGEQETPGFAPGSSVLANAYTYSVVVFSQN